MHQIIQMVSFVATAWLLWQVFNRWLWPLWLMSRGEYQLTIDLYKDRATHAEDQEEKNECYYHIADCFFRQGKYSSSMSWLEKVKASVLNERMRGKFYSLYANNLIMTRSDLGLAGRYLEQAKPAIDPENYSIYKCHLELLSKNQQLAEQMFPLLSGPKTGKKKLLINKRTLHPDAPFTNLMKNYVTGMYHRAYGDPKLAEKHLERAALFPYRNGISDHARELMGIKDEPVKDTDPLKKEELPVRIVKYLSGSKSKKEN